jgi:hypothetical protein
MVCRRVVWVDSAHQPVDIMRLSPTQKARCASRMVRIVDSMMQKFSSDTLDSLLFESCLYHKIVAPLPISEDSESKTLNGEVKVFDTIDALEQANNPN